MVHPRFLPAFVCMYVWSSRLGWALNRTKYFFPVPVRAFEIVARMYVCMYGHCLQQRMDQPVVSSTGNMFLPLSPFAPENCSRETRSAVPSRVSLLIGHTRAAYGMHELLIILNKSEILYRRCRRSSRECTQNLASPVSASIMCQICMYA